MGLWLLSSRHIIEVSANTHGFYSETSRHSGGIFRLWWPVTQGKWKVSISWALRKQMVTILLISIKMFRNYRWIVGELKCPQRNVTWFSRWWFQPNWKNISQHGNLPQIGNRGENQKYLKSPPSSFTMLQALWKKGAPITRNSSPFSRDEWAL